MIITTIHLQMTKQEFKFALQVEVALNTIPQPEYRQLMVEAIMVLTMLVENEADHLDLREVDFEVDGILREANNIFIMDVVGVSVVSIFAGLIPRLVYSQRMWCVLGSLPWKPTITCLLSLNLARAC